jgi:hypothetical protein
MWEQILCNLAEIFSNFLNILSIVWEVHFIITQFSIQDMLLFSQKCSMGRKDFQIFYAPNR